jgi:DNA-binding transcriptional regulator GbsR (MarR family)
MDQAARAKELQAFVEKIGTFFGMESRMPPSVARVLGLLLVSEPAHQSAEQIASQLQLSTGSVSGAVSLLQQVGLVRRVSFPGDRKYYYESDPQGMRQAMLMKLKSVNHGIALAQEGLELSPNNPRLQAMYDTYQIFESEVEMLIKRLES